MSYGLPIAAGVTIYVAASDLIPEVNREPGVKMALVVFIGVAILLRARPTGALALQRVAGRQVRYHKRHVTAGTMLLLHLLVA